MTRDARVLDDSDAQWADLIRRRVSVSKVSRRYWEAIPLDERERIAAAVPEGHWIYVKPGYRAKPGTTDVSLRDERNSVVREQRGFEIARMCWAVLPRLTITTDSDGWVEDIAS